MNLLKSVSIISGIVFLSRILGFIRDSVIAYFFGVSIFTDSFFLAFRFPNLLRRIFAEGAFSQSFILVLSEYKSIKNFHEIKKFVSFVFGFLIFILFFIVVLGVKFSYYIIYFSSPGFSRTSNQFVLSVFLLKIIFPYIFFISVVSFFSSILNVWKSFFVPSFSSVLFNVGIIFSIVFFRDFFIPQIKVIAFGVLFGSFLQLLYYFPFLKKINMLSFPRFHFSDVGIKKLIQLMLPAMIFSFLNQLSLFFNTVFASYLKVGSISWIHYANRLVDFPVGILGFSFSSILLPSLTKHFLEKKYERFQFLMNYSIKICFLLSIPCTIGLVILSQPIIISLFQYGNFTFYDTKMTQYIFVSYTISVCASVVSKIFLSCFYSIKDIKTPLKISIFTFFFTQLLNIFFIKILKNVGLSLSISFGIFLNAFMLYWKIRKKLIFIPYGNWKKFFFKVILSSLIMSISLIILLIIFPNWNFIAVVRVMKLLFFVLFSIFVYFFSLFVLGFDFKEIFQKIK